MDKVIVRIISTIMLLAGLLTIGVHSQKVSCMYLYVACGLAIALGLIGLLHDFKSWKWRKKSEVAPPDYKAQLEALKALSLAYEGARWDFVTPVLRFAFGNPPPPSSKCVWPPKRLTEREVNSRLLAVQHVLRQSENSMNGVIDDIKAAQDRLIASGFNVPDSWIILEPLEMFRGGSVCPNDCSVTEIVESAPAEDARLEKVIDQIGKNMKRLEVKVAASTRGA
jgi:hypothetical protein